MKKSKIFFNLLFHTTIIFLLYFLFLHFYSLSLELLVADSLCNELTGKCVAFINELAGFSRTPVFKLFISLIIFSITYLPVYILILKNLKKSIITVLIIYTSFFVINLSASIILDEIYSYKLINEFALQNGQFHDKHIQKEFNVYAGLAMVSWEYKIKDKNYIFHNLNYYKKIITSNPSHEISFSDHSFSPDITKYQEILNYLKHEKINIKSLKVNTKLELITLKLNNDYRIKKIDLWVHKKSLREGSSGLGDFVPVSSSDFSQIKVGMTHEQVSTILGSKGSEGLNFYRYKGDKNGWVDLYFDTSSKLKEVKPFYFNEDMK